MTFLGALFIFLGLSAFIISAIGLLRMPDLYSRIHAGAKSPTMATILIIVGAILLEPSWAPKLILLSLFILVTNPLSSSVIARASHKINTPYLNSSGIDELKAFDLQSKHLNEDECEEVHEIKEEEK